LVVLGNALYAPTRRYIKTGFSASMIFLVAHTTCRSSHFFAAVQKARCFLLNRAGTLWCASDMLKNECNKSIFDNNIHICGAFGEVIKDGRLFMCQWDNIMTAIIDIF